MNERFWENLEILLIDKGMSWADLALGKSLKVNMSIPVSLIVSIRLSVIISPIASCLNSNGWERIVAVLEIDYEDLFRGRYGTNITDVRHNEAAHENAW